MQQNENKKNSKRRLLLLILLLVCTLVLLGGSTYAWFTSNMKVTVEAMDLEVQVANGIEISADAQNWGPTLKKLDLYKAAGMKASDTTNKTVDAGSVNQFPKKLKNVSTIGNINLGTTDNPGNNRLELFNGTAATACYVKNENFVSEEATPDEEEMVLKPVESQDAPDGVDIADCITTGDSDIKNALIKAGPYAEGNKACSDEGEVGCDAGIGVFAFDIYLKLDNKSTVSLASGSYVKNTSKTDYGLKNTIRVAFVTLGTQPSDFYFANSDNISPEGKIKDYDTSKTYLTSYNTQFKGYVGAYGARQMNGFGSINIWEPNATQHTTGAITNADKNYSVALQEDQRQETNGIYADPTAVLPHFLQFASEAGMPNYYAKVQTVTQEILDTQNAKGEDDPKPYRNLMTYHPENTEESAGFPIFTAPAGVTKVRVYIWVEGQDYDTENNATPSTIQARLNFTTASATDSTEISESDFETYTNIQENVWRDTTPAAVKTPTAVTATETGTGA